MLRVTHEESGLTATCREIVQEPAPDGRLHMVLLGVPITDLQRLPRRVRLDEQEDEGRVQVPHNTSVTVTVE